MTQAALENRLAGAKEFVSEAQQGPYRSAGAVPGAHRYRAGNSAGYDTARRALAASALGFGAPPTDFVLAHLGAAAGLGPGLQAQLPAAPLLPCCCPAAALLPCCCCLLAASRGYFLLPFGPTLRSRPDHDQTTISTYCVYLHQPRPRASAAGIRTLTSQIRRSPPRTRVPVCWPTCTTISWRTTGCRRWPLVYREAARGQQNSRYEVSVRLSRV